MTHKTPQEGERETRTLAWIVEETISLRALACTVGCGGFPISNVKYFGLKMSLRDLDQVC